MPTVFREGSFEFRIYFRDHEPPHVHAVHPDGHVKILLGTRADATLLVSRVGGSVGDREVLRAFPVAERERETLLREWERIHGQAR